MGQTVIALFTGTVLLLLAIFFACGTHSRSLAIAFGLATGTMLLFPGTVDTWASVALYPHVDHLAADCFITAGLYFLRRGAVRERPSGHRAEIVAVVSVVLLCALFFSVPPGEVPPRVSAVMFTDPRFFGYGMTANLAVLYFVTPLLGAGRRRDVDTYRSVGRVLVVIALAGYAYVGGRMVVAVGAAPTGLAVVVSSVFSLSLSAGLAFVVVTRAVAYRRTIAALVASLMQLDAYLSQWSQTPLRRPRIRLVVTPLGVMVDLIARTADKIALLPAQHPVRDAALTPVPARPAGSRTMSTFGYSLEDAGRALFAAAQVAARLDLSGRSTDQ